MAKNAHVGPRQWLTSLINAIPPAAIIDDEDEDDEDDDAASPSSPPVSNPLRDFPPKGKPILLTLYALFEKELLPALDLLDRHLVSRLHVHSPPMQAQETRLYLVRSAQQHNASHRSANSELVNHYYEVRLQAWSCSCPAFVFSAFPASASESDRQVDDGQTHESESLVGGLTRGEDVPMCKHLLACVLVQHCSAFSRFVEERDVSMEELAGSAAGWYD